MKITVLGCGSSGGVPLIGDDWGACDPAEPRNRRLRASVLVEEGTASLLIDTSPDLRQQLLNVRVKHFSAVLFTHAHADHCHGIDDLRSIHWLMQKPVPIYGDDATLKDLEARFPYVFKGARLPGHDYNPYVKPIMIDGPFEIAGMPIVPFRQEHGYGHSLGFRIGDFAYTTDAHSLDKSAFSTLEGIKCWIVDCVREAPHPSHSHLAQTLDWIARVKPKRSYLTHMNHSLDYRTLLAQLPAGVEPAYDGLVIEC